jgi:uncharacterized protein (DUF2141 family)
MKFLLVLLFSVMNVVTLSAQKLTVIVTDIEADKGVLMVGVCNNEKDFPDTFFRGEKVKITGETMTVTFSDLPQGVYAVAVYQDENENGKLDKTPAGIPKEKYGFSNDQKIPNYKKSTFTFDKDTTVNIKLTSIKHSNGDENSTKNGNNSY